MRAKNKTKSKPTKQKVKQTRPKAAEPAPARTQESSGREPSAQLTPDTLLQMQRSHGNAFVERLLQDRKDPGSASAAQPSSANGEKPQVQRAVMSSSAWMKQSSRALRKRSKELVAIDIALANYHKTHTKSPSEQLEKLRDLQSKLGLWVQTKERDEKGHAKTRRKEAAKELNISLNSEMDKLKDKIGDEPDVSTSAGVSEKAKQLYKGAQSDTQAIMATVKAGQAQAPMASLNGKLAAMQDLSRTANEKYHGSNDAAELNAVIVAEVVVNAIQALQTLAEGYVQRNSSKPGEIQSRKSFAQDQLGRIMAMQGDLDNNTPNAASDSSLMDTILADVIKFNSFLKADQAAGEDFSTVEELLDSIDISTTMLGYQGTGGKGNEGFAEFYKPEEEDESSARSGTREAFSKLTPSDTGQADMVSGMSDIEKSLAGMGSDGIAIYKAIRTLKDPDASKEDKQAAKFQVAKYPLTTVSNVMALTGGALTWHRGMGNELASSGFGFEHTSEDSSGNQVVDVDVSTDVKMAGDFAGLFAGIIDSIQKVVDLVKFIKVGGGVDAKTKARTDRSKGTERRKDLEGLGNLLSKYTSTVASLANNTKSVIKLGYQIAGSGQNVSDAAGGVTGVANLGGVVPALGLIKAVLEAVRYGYRLARIAVRRGNITDKIEALKLSADFSVVDALEFTRESLDKRLVRLGINVAHAVAGIVAGGFNLSGIGAAPGMAIALASSAMKLGQTGFRKVKQYSREKKAEKRKKKDEQRNKSFESFEDWKNRKRMQAAETGSRGKALITWLDIKITRNWDKTKANKSERNRAVAMEILKMGDPDVYKSLGVMEELTDNPDDYQKRLEIVIGALTKRD